jgi:hypothetical protein
LTGSPVSCATALKTTVASLWSGDSKSGIGSASSAVDVDGVLAEAAAGEREPEQVLVRAAEAQDVGGEHRVAGLQERRPHRPE